MAEFKTAEELEENLRQYREQLAQVKEAIEQTEEGEQAEYEQYEKDLQELIQLTLDLLQDAPRANKKAPVPPASVATTSTGAAGGWGPGAECEAQWSGDNEWYNAIIVSVEPAAAPDGTEQTNVSSRITVRYPEYADETETLPLKCIRARPSLAWAPDDDTTLPSTSSNNNTYSQQTQIPSEMPKRMRINQNDSEKTKQKKRKLQKNFKRQQKQAERERAAEEKRNQWQAFRQSKVLKSKPGYFSGSRKRSQFELDDKDPHAKVGTMSASLSHRQVTNSASRPKQPRLGAGSR